MTDYPRGRFDPSRWFRGASPRTFRLLLHWFPPIRATGVRVDRISDDWREWDLRLPLRMRTRNYVGTHFGGSLYSAADPHYMLAWMHILGPDYVVWDKAATVRFRRPGRGTLHGTIRITEDEVEAVRALCGEHPKIDRNYLFEWQDGDGGVVAEVEKVLHFQRKSGVR